MKNIVEMADEDNEFVTMDDGFVYYWPKPGNGALQSHHLRILAEELDKRNKKWQDEINDYFDKEKNL